MTPDLSDIVLTRGGSPDGIRMSIADAVAAQAGEKLADPRHRPACASPVLMDWMTAWADRLDHDDRQRLRQYVAPLATSRGTHEQETTRVWLVIDWLIRANAPFWLHAFQLSGHADGLVAVSEIRYPSDLAEAHSAVRAAAQAARDTSDTIWRLVAEDAEITIEPAQPRHVGVVPVVALGPYEAAKARRQETWALVADATTTAIQAAQTLVECATSAIGYRTAREDELPEALRAIVNTITSAATGVAWRAVGSHTKQETWSWEAATDAGTTTREAVTSALRATEMAVRESAHRLIERMLS